MAVANRTIRVDGLAELRRAFVAVDKAIAGDLKDALEEAAAPVKTDAQALAISEVTRIGPDWWRMRVGTTRTIVYVAPVERGVKSRGRNRFRRPKFADKLLAEALEPALERNVDKVTRRADEMLGEVAKVWERTR